MPEAPKQNLFNKKNVENYNGIISNTINHNNKKALKYIEDVTINTDEIQERVLAEILSSNALVEYLQNHGLNGNTDRKTFKRVLPVVTYEDLKMDIDRIANGDTSPILCSKPISEFLTRSVFMTSYNLFLSLTKI
jgi:auxin responsive GH3 family protein